MKLNQTLIIASLVALSACASKVRLDDLPPVSERSTTEQSASTTTSSSAAGSASAGGSASNGSGNPVSGANAKPIATIDTVSDNKAQPDVGMLAKRSVYFDYDSFSIRDDAKPALQAHAKHLASNRTLKVALEGHTDERGGGEYNLALGQKRANAVQEALQLLGVSATQMEAVSFGKEKPKSLGSDEAGYAENRRVDIQYK